MPKINYYDGKKYVQYEVNNTVTAAYAEISQEEQREHWRTDKRPEESSLDEMLELGREIAYDCDIEQQYIETERIEMLLKAINALPRSHRELIKKVYYEDFPQAEIARQQGVSRAAITRQLNRIFVELKNLLRGFDT